MVKRKLLDGYCCFDSLVDSFLNCLRATKLDGRALIRYSAWVFGIGVVRSWVGELLPVVPALWRGRFHHQLTFITGWAAEFIGAIF